MSKPYTLKLEDRREYLYAYVSGEEDSYDISSQYWQELYAECERLGASKVLIEEDLLGNATMVDAFRLSTELHQMGFGGIKIAFVDRRPEQNKLNIFGELVGLNRGVNIKLCADVAGGEQWLSDE